MADLSDERWRKDESRRSSPGLERPSLEGTIGVRTRWRVEEGEVEEKYQTMKNDHNSSPYYKIISKDVREYHFIVPGD